MADDRCVLVRNTLKPLDPETDLDTLKVKLQGALYRANRIRAWALCEPYKGLGYGKKNQSQWYRREYVEHPTNQQVDAWLEDLNRLVEEVHVMLDRVHLG